MLMTMVVAYAGRDFAFLAQSSRPRILGTTKRVEDVRGLAPWGGTDAAGGAICGAVALAGDSPTGCAIHDAVGVVVAEEGRKALLHGAGGDALEERIVERLREIMARRTHFAMAALLTVTNAPGRSPTLACIRHGTAPAGNVGPSFERFPSDALHIWPPGDNFDPGPEWLESAQRLARRLKSDVTPPGEGDLAALLSAVYAGAADASACVAPDPRVIAWWREREDLRQYDAQRGWVRLGCTYTPRRAEAGPQA